MRRTAPDDEGFAKMVCLYLWPAEPLPAQQSPLRHPAALEEHELFRPPLRSEPPKPAAAEARKVRFMSMSAVVRLVAS